MVMTHESAEAPLLPRGLDERQAFVEAMSRAVMGVAVVATAGPAGRFGLTVGSMTSVSADPPTLLVCVHRKTPLGPAIARHGHFSVNVLAADQVRVAEVFAGRPRYGERFDFGAARWEVGSTSSPLLVGAAARFECELAGIHAAGTHDIVLGRVRAASATEQSALLYTRRTYGRPLPLAVNDAGLPAPVALGLDDLEL